MDHCDEPRCHGACGGNTRLLKIKTYFTHPHPYQGLFPLILPFIKCSTNCYKRVLDYQRSDFQYMADPRIDMNISDIETEIAQGWKKRTIRNSTAVCAVRRSSTKCPLPASPSATCAAGTWNMACQSPSDDLPSNLLALPVELLVKVMEYAEPSYEMQGFILRACRTNPTAAMPTQLMFYERRKWAEISLFQVNRAIRRLATGIWGQPARDDVLFDAQRNTVVVQGERVRKCDDSVSDRGFDYKPLLMLQDWGDQYHWIRHNGVLMFQRPMGQVIPWHQPTKMSIRFLEAVRKITIADDNDAISQGDIWEHIWRFLDDCFVNARFITIETRHMDACGAWPGIRTRDHYKARDLWVLSGLLRAENSSGEKQRIFPNLDCVIIEKTTTSCSWEWANWRHALVTRYTGEWLFETGKGNQPNVLIS
ncbi:Uu.00g085640.m01.CDS01 [Anthostomella pinea]|uniref:Uu.00g085640.m01.CDS01 n=1 Tax=Anthostomella pinea TaxID=933095 RepID=A0AAI8VM20_9PEZI|nr:Uu.00g085640.m01.CDS01 [Anthostomella pinea]